jgi:GNAT superfamily N-acetyltransferase
MDAILRIIVVTEENRNQSFGVQFLTIIEEWLKVHNYKILYIETSGRPMSFYKKRGYAEMLVDDPYLDPSDIPLGKKL